MLPGSGERKGQWAFTSVKLHISGDMDNMSAGVLGCG